jgi:hypothetical protein
MVTANPISYPEVPIRVITRAGIAIVLATGLLASPAFASRIHRAPTGGHSRSSHHAAPTVKAHSGHGQQAIDTQRVTAIQQALIKEHYLSGEPSSHWDADTQAAMVKYQSDQGWQTRLTPDSRALIKLGLGPDHSGAINASSSSNFNTLNAPALPANQSSGFVAASGVSH